MEKIKKFFASIFKKNGSVSIDTEIEVKNDTSVISENTIKKYNWMLLILAIILAFIFIIGIIPSSKDKKVEEEIKIVKTSTVQGVDSKIKFSKDEIKVSDQTINTFYNDKIVITALTGKIKIDSIKLDPPSSSLLIENNCDTELAGSGSCTVSISWYPLTQENLSSNITVLWSDLSSLTPKQNTSLIKLDLKTKEKKGDPIFVVKPEPIKAPEKPVVQTIKPVQPITPLMPKRSEVDCKKYAISAYDKNGTVIGWISPDKKVYSLRCTKVIGKLNLNGEIIDENGNIIGYSPDGYQETKLKKMLDIVIPKDWFDFDNEKSQSDAKWDNIIKARNDARAKVAKPADPKAPWKHRITDPDKIFEKYVNSKVPFTITGDNQVSTIPKDETYVIRRYKPIPAVIAYPIFTSKGYGQMPAIGVIERNVYGENGRTVIIPAGSKVLGQATGTWPDTYVNYAKVQIHWLRIIRPDGAEFVFKEGEAISADAQGKLGVPGKGATDYLEQFVKPMITAAVPAAINLLNPISSAYTSKFILDDGTGKSQMIQSGEEKSSEKAKQELVKTWNTVANQFVADSMKNNVPPFEVPAGTRITIYPTHDIMLRFNDEISFTKSKAEGGELKDVGAGKVPDLTPVADPAVAKYQAEAQESSQKVINIANAPIMNPQTQQSAPITVKAEPFHIPVSAPKTNPLPKTLEGETFIGQTLDGKYDIIQDSAGCFTTDPATGEIVEESYSEPEIGC